MENSGAGGIAGTCRLRSGRSAGGVAQAAEQLQASLESKQTGELMALLHADFQAQQQYDRDWARRTATLMFMRHRNVRVIALSQRSWIDATYPDRGHTEAQVALTGAEACCRSRPGTIRSGWSGDRRTAAGNWRVCSGSEQRRLQATSLAPDQLRGVVASAFGLAEQTGARRWSTSASRASSQRYLRSGLPTRAVLYPSSR